MNKEEFNYEDYPLPRSAVDKLRQQEPWKLEFCKRFKPPKEGCKIIHVSELVEALESLGWDMSEIAVCLEPISEMKIKDPRKTWNLLFQKNDDPNIGAIVSTTWLKEGRYTNRVVYDLNRGHCRDVIDQEPWKAKDGKIGRSVIRTYCGLVETTVQYDLWERPYLTVSTNSLDGDRRLPDDAEFLALGCADIMRLISASPLGGAPIAFYHVKLDCLEIKDNSILGPQPEKGWNKRNWWLAPEGVQIWMSYSDLIALTRDDRARAVAAFVGASLDPNANKYNILERMTISANFAGITLEEAEGLIELGAKNRSDLQDLKEKEKIFLAPAICPVSQ